MKLSILSKKLVLTFFGFLFALFTFELLCIINSKFKFFESPIQFYGNTQMSSSLTPHPLEQDAKQFIKTSRFFNWKHAIDLPTNFDRVRLKKTKSDPHVMFKPLSSFLSRLDYPGLKDSVYSATYSFDEFGFRKTPSSKTKNFSQTVLFLGCSFTFGDGLNDSETFPHFFAEMNNGTNVLNAGGSGDGPHDALYSLSDPKSRFGLYNEKIDTAVYTALPDHINRVTCSFDICVRHLHLSPSNLTGPMYVLNDRKLIYKGLFRDNFPWNQSWLKYVTRSEFLKTFNIFSSVPSDQDFKLTVEVFKAMKNNLSQKWGVKRFVVAFYPMNSDHQIVIKLQKMLEENGIETFNFNNLNAESIDYDLFYKMDGHPTPAGAYLFSWLLSESLKK